jgi:hypothetical protein
LFNLKGSENSYFSLPIFWAIRWKPQFWLVCLTPRASNQQTYPQILWELAFRKLKILRFFLVGIRRRHLSKPEESSKPKKKQT